MHGGVQTHMSIGDNIRRRRKELQLTQTELGQRVHKSAQVISNWERGYTTGITIEDLLALADALSISILALIPRAESYTTNANRVAENITDQRLVQLVREYPHLDEKSKTIIDAIISLSKDNPN